MNQRFQLLDSVESLWSSGKSPVPHVDVDQPDETETYVTELDRFRDDFTVLQHETVKHIRLLDSLLQSPNSNVPAHASLSESLDGLRRLIIQIEDLLQTAVESIQKSAEATQHRLKLQIQHSNELETVLADRELQVVAQSSELNEVESQLTASAQVISALHRRLSANHVNLVGLLDQLNSSSSNSSSSGALPAVPAVLELATNLDAAYAELQDSERLRIIAEQRASSAVKTARTLRRQMRQLMFSASSSYDLNYVEVGSQTHLASVTVSHETQTDVDPDNGTQNSNADSLNATSKSSSIVPFIFSRPNDVLAELSALTTSPSPEQLAALFEALRNASCQIDRLTKHRHTQKYNIEQLQHRIALMNSELDATVDALRFHRTSAESERGRSAAELATLRMQLAKAHSLLGHQKRMADRSATLCKQSPERVDQLSSSSRAASASPTATRSQTSLDDSSDVPKDVVLELELTKSELAQLRTSLTQQKVAHDREATKLRGQLAEASADARSLRAQVVRLQNVVNAAGKTESPTPTESVCTNCLRLQRLLEIIQTKRNTSPLATAEVGKTASVPLFRQSADKPNGVCVTNSLVQCTLISSESSCVDQPPCVVPNGETDHDTPVSTVMSKVCKSADSLAKGRLWILEETDRLRSERELLDSERLCLKQERSNMTERLQNCESELNKRWIALQNEQTRIAEERTRLAEDALSVKLAHERILVEKLQGKRSEIVNHVDVDSKDECASASKCDQFVQTEQWLYAKNVVTCNGVHDSEFYCSSEDKVIAEYLQTKAIQTDFYDCSSIDSSDLALPFELLGEGPGRWRLDNASPDIIPSNSFPNSQFSSFQELVNDVLALRNRLLNESSRLNSEKGHSSNPQQQCPEYSAAAASAAEITPVSPVEDSTNSAVASISYNQLRDRLIAAEREAEDAMAQLKASNAEFLVLRERVSHAAVERAYLKSTVEGLDDQVSHLEQTLFERTQQLHQCREELAKADQNSIRPLWRSRFPVDINFSLWITIRDVIHSKLVFCWSRSKSVWQTWRISRVPVGPELPLFERPHLAYVERSPYRTILHHFTGAAVSRVYGEVAKTPSTLLSSLRSRPLMSQPRRSVIIGILLYVIFLHLWIIRCWLF